MDLAKLSIKAKDLLDNDPDAIFETDIEEGRLLICRTGIDKDDYRVSLEKQIEIGPGPVSICFSLGFGFSWQPK